MFDLIRNDLWISMQAYLPFAIISGFIVIISTYILFTVVSLSTDRDLKHQFIKKLPFLLVFYIYIFLLAGLTFLSRVPGSRFEVNLKVFGTITNNIYGNRYVVENIFMFIPLGMLFPLLWKRLNSAINCLIVGFFFSLLIEVSQYVTKRGYFQVDDLIFNTLGALLGFYVLSGLKALFSKAAENKKGIL